MFIKDNSQRSKSDINALFSDARLIFSGCKCLHATSQKRALSHAISLTVNYRLFAHGDVSYIFNGENDNVVLEYSIKHKLWALIIVSTMLRKYLSNVLLMSTHN